MNKQTIITILLALFAVAGKGQEIVHKISNDWQDTVSYAADSVTVSFQLSSKTSGEMATLIYPDFLICDVVSLKPTTDKEGRWTVKIPAYRTVHIQIWDDNKIRGIVWGAINLFCRPGTTAEILLDDINDRLVFMGENAEAHNAQVQHYLKIENFHGQMFDMDMQEAAQTIRRIRERNFHNIDTLCAAHPDLPKKYVESLRQMARYSFALDMTQNAMGHSMDSIASILERGENSLPKEHLALLREAETEELLFPKSPLPCDAIYYLNTVFGSEILVQTGFITEVEETNSDRLLLEFASQNKVIDAISASSDVKQILKTSQFISICNGKLTAEREDFLKGQISTEAFKAVRHYIHHKETVFASLPEEEITTLKETPLDSLIDGKEIFQKLISPYRGRVIYIDVWGTWCGPCQRELEHLPELHETLKGLPVTYMYLANNSPEEIWKKAAKRFGLEGTEQVNLLLPPKQQNAVEQYLGVQGFPTYVLVAPDGSIVTNEAPRPSNPSSVREAILEISGK